MAKDLYIHTINKHWKYKVTKWIDVKTTRDGKIVTNNQSKYKIAHGYYKRKEYLDVINVIEYGYPNRYTDSVEYISFDKESLTDLEIKELSTPFIEELLLKKEKLEKEIMEIDEKMLNFKMNKER